MPVIREYEERDFLEIQRLSAAEGWMTASQRPAAAGLAWQNAEIALVVEEAGAIVGFLRALSDRAVTTYVCELLVVEQWRGQGIATQLLDAAQARFPGTRIDLLGEPEAEAFYTRRNFRPFLGFRRSARER